MTVWRVLKRHQVKAVVKRRKKSDYIRYSKEIPGERIQLDVMKVRNGAYQFTAIRVSVAKNSLFRNETSCPVGPL